MRISDWSSDVCSSDLAQQLGAILEADAARAGGIGVERPEVAMHQNAVADVLHQTAEVVADGGRLGGAARCRRGLRRRLVLHYQPEIGRAHVRIPVTNAHLVCRLLLQKKTQNN